MILSPLSLARASLQFYRSHTLLNSLSALVALRTSAQAFAELTTGAYYHFRSIYVIQEVQKDKSPEPDSLALSKDLQNRSALAFKRMGFDLFTTTLFTYATLSSFGATVVWMGVALHDYATFDRKDNDYQRSQAEGLSVSLIKRYFLDSSLVQGMTEPLLNLYDFVLTSRTTENLSSGGTSTHYHYHHARLFTIPLIVITAFAWHAIFERPAMNFASWQRFFSKINTLH
jgi:hypothetical protein